MKYKFAFNIGLSLIIASISGKTWIAQRTSLAILIEANQVELSRNGRNWVRVDENTYLYQGDRLRARPGGYGRFRCIYINNIVDISNSPVDVKDSCT